MTVGKSYVAATLQRHGHQVVQPRRRIQRRQPRRMPRNLLWGLDLTFITCGRESRPVFGLIDHGTRACVALRSIPSKATIQILRALLDVVELFGTPKAIRTDNEGIFCSWLFRLALAVLGIRHQRIAPFAPWQNGRIDRFFGVLKEAARGRRWTPEELQEDLDLFRTWHNHVRPHQHLDGLTPAVAWSGRPELGRGKPYFFSAWEGLLTGFYIPE